MLKYKKQLLGAIGLALVAIMVAIACAMPTPDAAALEAGSVGLTVYVGDESDQASVSIVSPADGDTVVYKNGVIIISYSKTIEGGLKVSLKNGGAYKGDDEYDASGSEIELDTSHCPVADGVEPQQCEIPYTLDADLTTEDPTWVYVVTARVTGRKGNMFEDSSKFLYQAAYISFNDEWNKTNGNPIVEIQAQEQVDKFVIQVTDANGKKLFVGADGSDEPLIVSRDDLTFVDGVAKVELPFDKYNAATGSYEVGLVAYATGSDTPDVPVAMSIAKNKIEYKKGEGNHPGGPNRPDEPTNPDDPNTPEVPDTGLNMFSNLNISSADYIITGLAAFGVVTAFAMYLIMRRNKR